MGVSRCHNICPFSKCCQMIACSNGFFCFSYMTRYNNHIMYFQGVDAFNKRRLCVSRTPSHIFFYHREKLLNFLVFAIQPILVHKFIRNEENHTTEFIVGHILLLRILHIILDNLLESRPNEFFHQRLNARENFDKLITQHFLQLLIFIATQQNTKGSFHGNFHFESSVRHQRMIVIGIAFCLFVEAVLLRFVGVINKLLEGRKRNNSIA